MRKRKPKGEPYARTPKTDGILQGLLSLSDELLLASCQSDQRDVAGYVPTECLVYLVRTRHGALPRTSEQLFRLLAERVTRRLPARSNSDGSSISLTGSNISDEVFGNFVAMLAADRDNYDERLDIYEICFDKALKMLRLDGRKKVWRHEKHDLPLEIEENTGQFPKELAKEVGPLPTVAAFDLKALERVDDRERLESTIDTLPPLQRHILHLVRQGLPLYSEKPDTPCVSKTLKKSDKTIRLHHQQAIHTLKSTLNGEKKT